jgi:hypothetical protein
MGYYGFREEAPDGRQVISERGRALLSSDAAVSLEAKQQALVASGFHTTLDRFSTSPVNLTAIEGVLHEDLDVPEQQVKKIANVLVESAEDAELIVENRFQVAPIQQAIEAVGEITVTTSDKPMARRPTENNHKDPAPPRPPGPKGKPQTPAAEKVEVEGQSGPFAVSVEIEIDAKDHTPQEIGQIVREVREALTTTA